MYGIEKNKWGFKEGRDFSGLIPKANAIIGLITGYNIIICLTGKS